MPWKYCPKEGAVRRMPYDPQKIKNAVKAVNEEGVKFKTAARTYGVNVMTLKRLCRKGKDSQPGHKHRQIFSEEQEKESGKYLTDMSHMYYGLTVPQLRKLAFEYGKLNKVKYPDAWEKTQQAPPPPPYLVASQKESAFTLRRVRFLLICPLVKRIPYPLPGSQRT